MSIPTNEEINAQAQRLGIANSQGICPPRARAAVAKSLAASQTPQEDVENLHEVVARFDKNLCDNGVENSLVRAAAVGALVFNLTNTNNIDFKD